MAYSMRAHGAASVPGSKRYELKVRMVWGSFLIAAAALKTLTRNGYSAKASTSLVVLSGRRHHWWARVVR